MEGALLSRAFDRRAARQQAVYLRERGACFLEIEIRERIPQPIEIPPIDSAWQGRFQLWESIDSLAIIGVDQPLQPADCRRDRFRIETRRADDGRRLARGKCAAD